MNKLEFLKKLDRCSFKEPVRKKYEALFDQLQQCQNIPEEIVEERLKNIKFVAYMSGGNVTLLESVVKNAVNVHCMSFPVNASDNLVGPKHFIDGESVSGSLTIMATTTVFHPADDKDRPVLSLKDIVRQLPEEYADRTKAVCLLLEDDYQVNGYNLIFGQYEYKVILLG